MTTPDPTPPPVEADDPVTAVGFDDSQPVADPGDSRRGFVDTPDQDPEAPASAEGGE